MADYEESEAEQALQLSAHVGTPKGFPETSKHATAKKSKHLQDAERVLNGGKEEAGIQEADGMGRERGHGRRRGKQRGPRFGCGENGQLWC